MAEFVIAGLGVSMMPPRMMAPFEKHNLVKRILPEWSEASADITLVMPTGQLPHRVRLFVDYLAAHFASPELAAIDIEPIILAHIAVTKDRP